MVVFVIDFSTRMASASSSLALLFSISFHLLKKSYLLSIPSSRFQPSIPIHQPLIAKPVLIASHKNLGFRIRSTMADLSTHSKQKVELFDSEEELAIELAKYTAALSEKFVKERGAFTVVVSGGSLIKSLMKLTETPFVEAVEWYKWHVFWVDERVVSKDDPESNYKLAFDGFLSKV